MKTYIKVAALALLIGILVVVVQENRFALPRAHLFLPSSAQRPGTPASSADQVSAAETFFAQSPGSDDPLRSLWVESEKRRYLALLATKPCGILVVPVQTLQFGFDRATRSLMTAQLAQAVEAASGECVVDPYLASLALGEGVRQVDAQDLTKAVHAKKRITVYAGPDRLQKLNFVVEATSTDSSGRVGSVRKSWIGIDLSAGTPMDKWQAYLPEVLQAIGMKAAPAKSVAPASSDLTLPLRPEELINTTDSNPLNTALRYQLLAILGPDPGYRQTERLYEKSWLAASDADSMEGRRIRARALLHLGYRPAALALLETDTSAEARCLVELLNGNLYRAQAAAAQIKSPVERFLAAIEVRDLSWSYGRIDNHAPLPAELLEVAGKSLQWATLIEARANDGDVWHVADNMRVEKILEASYPTKGTSVASTIAGASVLGELPKDGELALLPVRHLHKLIADDADKFCCSAFQLRPGHLDFLELIDARALANAEKSIDFVLHVQGDAERALEMLDAYDAEYAGHPHLSILRAEANERLIETRKDERVAERQQKAMVAARLTAYWEQSTTPYTLRAAKFLQAATTPLSAYFYDFPPRQRDLHFDYSTSDISSLPQSLNAAKDEAEKKRLLAILDQRFEGNPGVAGLRLLFAGDNDDDAKAIAQMREMLAHDPDNYALSATLAQRLVDVGRYDQALEVAKSYPGFKPGSSENSVSLSNYAMGIGSLLYWHGEIEPAAELYKMAAGYDNGSDASLVAKQRLLGLAGDYAGYATVARHRIERYDVSWAARDYLCMLFAMGYDKEAWAAFDKISARYTNTEIWHAAMVGHRVAGTTDDAVRAWLANGSIRGIRVGLDQPALRFALTYFIVDRPAVPDLEKFIASIEGQPQNSIDTNGLAVAHPFEGAGHQITSPSAFRISTRQRRKEGEPVPSAFVLFADAYSAQRRGDNAAAVDAFDRLAASYPIEEGEMSFALPYFAMSAAKTGDKLQLQSFLAQLPTASRQFDFDLAQAIFDGFAHKPEASIEHLQRAFQHRPYTDGRAQLSPYQFAEACIWLFDETGDARYRDLALDWARKYQRIDPAFAWAYALEARYSATADASHTRAIAIADYLDRNSFWLSTVRKNEVEKARAWFKANNPFAKHLNPQPTDI